MEKVGLMKDTIISAIAEVTGDQDSAGTLTMDSDLINDVGLDSIDIVTMILNLEEELDIVIDFDDFDFDEITTIGQLAEYLQELKKDEH